MCLLLIVIKHINSGTTLYTLLRNMSKKSALHLDEVKTVPAAMPMWGWQLWQQCCHRRQWVGRGEMSTNSTIASDVGQRAAESNNHPERVGNYHKEEVGQKGGWQGRWFNDYNEWRQWQWWRQGRQLNNDNKQRRWQWQNNNQLHGRLLSMKTVTCTAATHNTAMMAMPAVPAIAHGIAVFRSGPASLL